ncbi:MAG: nitroreductase/quinone reductase family protein [Chloroflexia bacterium]
MSDNSPNNWNQQIIDEFHANGGKVGGPFAEMNLLLLTTTGAKSGRQYTNPVAYNTYGDRLVVFATKSGAPTNPDWYHNLVANPEVTVELGTETFKARAVPLTGEDRDRAYQKQADEVPQFATYPEKTTRVIPVIALDRLD